MCLGVEELLIDFQELIGPHSGENMVEAVWATMGLLERCGYLVVEICINNLSFFQVITIVMDNASNNNTLLESLQHQCEE